MANGTIGALTLRDLARLAPRPSWDIRLNRRHVPPFCAVLHRVQDHQAVSSQRKWSSRK
jgi:hypothetical protein